MKRLTRRDWIRYSAAGIAAASCPTIRARDIPRSSCTLSIGTYAFPDMPLEEAISLVSGIGYDGIEIAVRAGSPGNSAMMNAEQKHRIRNLLNGKGLQLTSLMEHLYPAVEDKQHREQVARLRRSAELGHELAPDSPPIVQTVLGGGEWDYKKNLFRDRLGDWMEATKATATVLAIKPHRGGAMSRPDEAIWLIQQLGDSPWLRMVYDYSHYAFRDMQLKETVKTSLPYTGHVVVKDVMESDGKPVFLLPGESGLTDYAELLRLFYDGGYRGDVCCEVSRQIWDQPDYDAEKAASACYHNLAGAMGKANIPRG